MFISHLREATTSVLWLGIPPHRWAGACWSPGPGSVILRGREATHCLALAGSFFHGDTPVPRPGLCLLPDLLLQCDTVFSGSFLACQISFLLVRGRDSQRTRGEKGPIRRAAGWPSLWGRVGEEEGERRIEYHIQLNNSCKKKKNNSCIVKKLAF